MELNADVNAKSTDGKSAVLLASRNGHTECLQEILSKVTDTTDIKEALYHATFNERHDCVNALRGIGAVAVIKLEGHSSSVWSVAWSADGRRVVSGSDDKTIRIWDVETGLEEKRLKGHSSSCLLYTSPSPRDS